MIKIPNPLNCISIKIISFPKNVKSLAVSIAVNPVTQTALIEVKNASAKDISCTVVPGNSKRPAPLNVSNKKLVAILKEGLFIRVYNFCIARAILIRR